MEILNTIMLYLGYTVMIVGLGCLLFGLINAILASMPFSSDLREETKSLERKMVLQNQYFVKDLQKLLGKIENGKRKEIRRK